MNGDVPLFENVLLQGNCNEPCYKFEQLVYVPYESNLIKRELLTADQVTYSCTKYIVHVL